MAIKARRHTRKVAHLPQHASTFHGVQEWHKREFEKFGWMLLARAKGYDFKVKAYQQAIWHMIATIEHLMTEYRDPDRLHDLNVLHMNAQVLYAAAMKL